MSCRDHKLRLSMTDAEKASISWAARAAGLPLATWCRMVLLKAGLAAEEAAEEKVEISDPDEAIKRLLLKVEGRDAGIVEVKE
jgi:uncharacterized protein YgfB (UPF0149 family)